MPAVMWFRRDLRLQDNPALVEAAEAADGEVLALFVLDPALTGPSGAPRLAVLHRTLRALDEQLHGRLVIRHGQPAHGAAPGVQRDRRGRGVLRR